MVYELLRPGKENATKSRELCKRLRIDERTLRQTVSNEREKGLPICNCNNGYYIAATLEELEHTRNRFKAMEKSNHESVTIFNKMIEEWKQETQGLETARQMTIEDYL